MPYNREPNTNISSMLNYDKVKETTKKSVSAKPDTLQVYSFNGGGVSDQLPRWNRKKGQRELVTIHLQFLKKVQNQSLIVHIPINHK